MSKRLLPYGVYDYEKLRNKNFLYIDKTEYIEKLEVTSEYILFTRPRRFGKSLFVSTLENYYDINKKDKFDKLFADTYIGKNPTDERNKYYVLRFNFSGLNTQDENMIERAFISRVVNNLKTFINNNNIDDVHIDDNNKDASMIFDTFITDISPKLDHPIYVMIDEYDQFANELLGFNKDAFLESVQENGFVRKFYEVLKIAVADSTVGRIFITGVSPIMMDGMTSGFNIALFTTCEVSLNEMLGFTEEEVKSIIEEVVDFDKVDENVDTMLEKMKLNYDGYKFSRRATKHVYNSDMCLYYLRSYQLNNCEPELLVDNNMQSDYKKLINLFTLGKTEDKRRNLNVLENLIVGKNKRINLTQQFKIGERFTTADFCSLLFYLGFLTIKKQALGTTIELEVPNETIKGLYFDLFLKTIQDKYKFYTDTSEIPEIFEQMALEGKNNLYVKYIEEVLHAMSNRDFQGMREIDVKMIAFTVSMMARSIYDVKSEREVEDGYIDLAYLPRVDIDVDYYALIEFKYLKKSSATDKELENLTKEGTSEIEKYIKESEIAKLNESGKLKKWVLIFVKDKCMVNKEI